MKALVLVTLSILISACLKVSDIEEENESNPIAPATTIANLDVPFVEMLDAANSYRVHLPFPPEASVAHRIRQDQEADLEAIPLNLENGVLVDEKPEPGATYHYQFGYNQNGNFHELKTYEISVPQDKDIQKEEILTTDTTWNQYRRVFIGPKGIITTQNYALNLHADEIISKGGLIRTFPKDARSTTGKGRSGGSIQISTRTARGELKVEIRGEHGAHGAKGADYSGPPAMGKVTGNNIRNIKITYEPEKPGGPGGNGSDGGGTGFFDIKIEEKHSFNLIPHLKAGKGGDRGPGGAGQKPNPGSNKSGAHGPPGAAGQNGLVERICLFDLNRKPCWTIESQD